MISQVFCVKSYGGHFFNNLTAINSALSSYTYSIEVNALPAEQKAHYDLLGSLMYHPVMVAFKIFLEVKVLKLINCDASHSGG